MTFGAAWNDFWFRDIDVRQYAALRILFGALSASYFVCLLPYSETQFSAAGWLGPWGPIAEFNGGSWSLFFPGSGYQSVTFADDVLGLGIIAASVMMIGWHSRVAAGITWMVWVSLWNRNPLLLDGDDAVLKLMAFYLMLAPAGHAWSVDARTHRPPIKVPIWPLRLIQFQIALIYFVSGWVKFYSPEWLDGTILQYVLIHPQYSRWDGWALIGFPPAAKLLALIADSIRWWEVLFPLLLLHARTRLICLALGVMFHLGLLATMHLRGFPFVMLALYPALLPNGVFTLLETKLLGSARRCRRI